MNKIIRSKEVPCCISINLGELFDGTYILSNDFPEESVIYCLHNLDNDKLYIGQAKYFWERLIGPSGFNHKDTYNEYVEDGSTHSYLYNSIRKHTPYRFEVIVLEEVEDLNERESFWISELHTCIYDDNCWGYNMNWGGDNCDQLHQPGVYERSLKTFIERYGCTPIEMMLSDECQAKARETLYRRYGYAWGDQLNTPESIRKRLQTNALKYNGDPCGQFHTDECYEKVWKTNLERYGDPYGKLTSEESLKKSLEIRTLNGDGDPMYGCHTPEAVSKMRSTNIERYGSPMGQCHTPEAEKRRCEVLISHWGSVTGHLLTEESLSKSKLTRQKKVIDRIIDELIKDGLELTGENYWNYSYDSCGSERGRKTHIRNVLNNISEYRKLPKDKWTDVYEKIFNWFELNPEIIYGLY